MAWQPDYATTAELRSFVRVLDTDDDTQIGLAIAAASRSIDRSTGRQFGVVSVAEARYYTARYDALRSRWAIPIDDLMTTTSLAVAFDSDGDETYADTITDYALRPRNAAVSSWPWTELAVLTTSDVTPTAAPEAVRVTAVWGWTEVPDAVKEACLLQSSRFLARRDAPFGVAGSAQIGSELRLLAKVDPDVEVILRPYRRSHRTVVFA